MHSVHEFLFELHSVSGSVKPRHAAGVDEDHLFALLDLSFADHVDDAGEGLSGVAGIHEDAFL